MSEETSGGLPTAFQQKLAEKRAREAAAKSALPNLTVPEYPSEYAASIPDQDTAYERSEEDKALDDVIERVDILDAYSKWCGKMTPKKRGSQTESIMISCPKPGHADKHPSAWVNTEKQTWFCGSCQEGGDKFDIAAFYFNFPVPGYKEGSAFHDLRRKMAESYGFAFFTPPGATAPIMVPPEEEPEAEPESESVSITTPELKISHIHDFIDEEEIIFPTLNWREIVEPDTFLYKYCDATAIDDYPEEFNFWNGLIALGLAVGRDVTMFDRLPVKANLFVCLLGHTGDGKSRSFSHLKDLLATALPHDWSNPNSKGARIIMTPGSAEVLIFQFSKPVPDPVNPKLTAYFAPVRGMIEFNELSQLTSRAARQGNALKPTMMQFYDGDKLIASSSISSGTKEAHNSFACAFTSTQPKALRDLIRQTDADSGFLNRWVFASGKSKTRVAIGGAKINLTEAVAELKDVHTWAGLGKEIKWSSDAEALFTSFFHDILEPKKKEDQSGLLTRIDLLMKKLILLMTINGKQNEVQASAVQRAIAMYEYVVSSYGIPASQLGTSLINDVYDEIIRHCRRITEKEGRGPTQRELGQRLKRKNYPVDLIAKTLKLACDSGEIQIMQGKPTGPGRPSVRYKYVG